MYRVAVPVPGPSRGVMDSLCNFCLVWIPAFLSCWLPGLCVLPLHLQKAPGWKKALGVGDPELEASLGKFITLPEPLFLPQLLPGTSR